MALTGVVQSHALASDGVELQGASSATTTVAEIYEEYFFFVWRALSRFGVAPSRLEDAVHDVFLVVHRRLPEFEHRSTVKTWLYGIAMRVAKVHREQERRGARQACAEPPTSAVEHDPHEALARAQARALVQGVLDEMDFDRRAVFVLVELEQATVPQIAETLGLPLNTVYSRLRLARHDFELGVKRMRAKDLWRLR